MNFESSNPVRRVTPTAETHYNAEEFEYHLHDLCYNSEELAVSGNPEQAEFNLWHMLKFQREDGFLPNQVLTVTASKLHLERWTFNHNRFSDYGQPPVLAQPIKATFNAYREQGRDEEAYEFLGRIYPRARAFYEFHDRRLRFLPDCSLIFIYHPHMSGRDRDPMINTHKKFPKILERDGPDTPWIKDKIRVPVDYAQVVRLSLKQKKARWEIAKARQNYCLVDPEFNAKYAQNLEILAGLAEEIDEPSDAETYYLRALAVEEDAKKYLWQPQAEWPTPRMRAPGQKHEGAKFTKGLFLAINGKGEFITEENSLGNLGAVGFKGLAPEQVRALLRLALVSYNTKVPFASTASESPMFDPYNQINWQIHSGGTWAYQNRYLADSFRWHGQRADLLEGDAYLCEMVADLVADISKKVFLPRKPEFVNPLTGEPQRPQVKGFGMAGQVNLIAHYDHLSRLVKPDGRVDQQYFNLVNQIGRLVPVAEIK